MSDFLSNFNHENYQQTRQKKEQKRQAMADEEPGNEQVAGKETSSKVDEQQQISAASRNNWKTTKEKQPLLSEAGEDLMETDPSYQKKRRRKFLFWGLSAFIVVLFVWFGYYQLTHVKVPNFEGKELAQVRQWTDEHKVSLKVKQVYHFDKAPNIIIRQAIKNQKIKKGSQLQVEASLGPDPNEPLQLPDFQNMKVEAAKRWLKDQKAENLTLLEEYSETVPAGSFLKFEITSKDVKKEDYQRQHKAKLYYSKGKEVFEKDITMPDLTGKAKEEAQEWAKKNDVTLKMEETDSEQVELGKVISQSVTKETKIAKKDTVTITVSTGKAVIVPDFSQFTSEEAAAQGSDLQIQVKQVFHETVPYGRFISQTIASGQKYTDKEEKPTIQVYYSLGRPYIKDLRENTLEGDLQKVFFEEYQSKGANITYQVYYVDSASAKGTVVNMSVYNEFVPLNFVVKISISKGNLAGADTGSIKLPKQNQSETNTVETVSQQPK